MGVDINPISDQELANLFVANSEFDELEKALNIFCPFEAIGMVSQEIRHGHFLSYLFDPQRPHGFGTLGIRALMTAAVASGDELSSDLNPIDVHLMDFDSVSIHREWRHIDILIEVPDQNLVIAIELKIDANEHSGQLGRYRQVVENNWPARRKVFIYLTKSGDEPSEDGTGWLSVGLEVLAEELDGIARKKIGNVDARNTLAAYISMLRRHHLNDNRLEDLAESLWSKHKEALEFLADRRPEGPEAEIFRGLSKKATELAEGMSRESGEKIVLEHVTSRYIRFAIEKLDKRPDFTSAEKWTPNNRMLLIEVAKNGRSIRPMFVLGPGNQKTRNNIFADLKNSGVDLGSQKNKTEISAQWSRLVACDAYKFQKDGNDDIDKAIKKVGTALERFAREHVPKYVKALLEQ